MVVEKFVALHALGLGFESLVAHFFMFSASTWEADLPYLVLCPAQFPFYSLPGFAFAFGSLLDALA